ncbi:hypothetical protein ACFQFC_00115 [Amorphoplanes digitatis]|uniref:Uncharacterized protein n=1 Tax=Actinoplanes digitatis TaxID=1868 RepID=A0A7W7HXG5_9ACTN|nr:hypothetical protein [Actinoplanes digitatis]MBB4762579.1 hypothetical protein [Actinoplanes digitatis]
MADTVSVVHFGEPEAAEVLAAGLGGPGASAPVVEAQRTRAVAADLALLVLLALPVHGFLKKLGEMLGETTGAGIAKLFNAAFARVRGGGAGRSIVLRDGVHGMDVELTADLPPAAYEQLGALMAAEAVTLRYDPGAGAWVAAGPPVDPR